MEEPPAPPAGDATTPEGATGDDGPHAATMRAGAAWVRRPVVAAVTVVVGLALSAAAGIGLADRLGGAQRTPRLQVVQSPAPPATSAGAAAGSDSMGTAANAEPATSAPLAATGEHQSGDPSSYLVRVADQAGDGRSIMVDQVVITGRKGWVVIHADAGGVPGEVIGVSPLVGPGSVSDLRVVLRTPLTASARVFAMVHLDDGRGVYDYPAGDPPATVGGQIVMVPVSITVRP